MRNSKNFIDTLTIFFKNKYKFLLTLISTLCIIAIGLIYTIPIYEAKASILVKFGREYVYDNLSSDTKHPSNYFDRDNVINNELEILSSRELIEEVITNYSVHRLYYDIYEQYATPQDRTTYATDKFIQNFSVKGVADSDLIRISFQHTDSQTASAVLNILLDMYKIKHLKTFRDKKTTRLLQQKASSYKKNLADIEEKIKEFKQLHQTYSFEDQVNILLQQRSDLDISKKEAQSHLSSLEQKLIYLYQKKQDTSPDIELYRESNKPSTNAFQEKLLSLKIKEQNLLKNYKPKHPNIVSIRKEIKQVERLIKNRNQERNTVVKVGRNSIFENIEEDIVDTESALNSQKITIEKTTNQITELDNQLHMLASLENELKDLQRQARQYEEQYRNTLKKLEVAHLADEMDRQQITNIRTVQAAKPPTEPIQTHRNVKLTIGLMLGLAAGVVVTLGSEYLGQGLTTPTIAEKRLHLPVLTSVSNKQNHEF